MTLSLLLLQLHHPTNTHYKTHTMLSRSQVHIRLTAHLMSDFHMCDSPILQQHTAVSSLSTTAKTGLCYSFSLKQPISALQAIKQTLLSMQLSILIYKQRSQQELLTRLFFCQAEALRALGPYPGGVTHLWLNLTLRKQLFS